LGALCRQIVPYFILNASLGLLLLDDLVAVSTDLNCAAHGHHLCHHGHNGLRFGGGFLGGPPPEVRLMSFVLGVCKVVPLIAVKRQTESAFVSSHVVAHKVGNIGDVDGLKGQLAHPLPPVNARLFH
jgi:hypothetical protein